MNKKMMRTNKKSETQQKKQENKYCRLTLLQKMELISSFDKGENKNNLSIKFNITQHGINKILKKRDVIIARFDFLKHEQGDLNRTRLSGVENSPLEKCLYRWFLQKRELGEPISGPLLREKALQFNKDLGGSSTFCASDGWCSNFKKRHNIRYLSVKGEILSNNKEASSTFQTEIQLYIENNNYTLNNVFNADETGLEYKILLSKTLVAGNEKEAFGRKESRERVTLLVCANATGNLKLPILVIGKYKKPRCFKNISQLPVEYRAQSSAWMDQQLFIDWYQTIYLPFIKANGKEGDRFLLLLDNAPSHPSEEILNKIDPCSTVKYLPPNTTAYIQPMHQGVISSLKKDYRTSFLRNLLAHNIDNEVGIKNFIKQWSLLDCCLVIAESWSSVKEQTIINAWKKLLKPSESTNANNLEDTSEIKGLISDINKKTLYLDEEDISAWLKSDEIFPTFYVMNDIEIVKWEKNLFQMDEKEASDEEFCLEENVEQFDPLLKPSITEAKIALSVLMSWFSANLNMKIDCFSAVTQIQKCVLAATE